ncbi:MAG: efflux transporter outer membrane subunit [Planctomycetota bacterium]|jgi:NodT family efflux transporter outer membrane factor (OMF) lipoprotein
MRSTQRFWVLSNPVFGLLLVLLGNTGCLVGPNYRPPPVQVADEWLELEDPRIIGEPADMSAWWTVFNDPVLDELIQTAFEQNLTLRAAGIRIATSRYQRAVVIGELFPQFQQGSGSYSHIQKNLGASAGGKPPEGPSDAANALGVIQSIRTDGVRGIIKSLAGGDSAPRQFDFWQLGFDMAWEVDFWGRFRRSIEAADADLDASIQDYEDVLVTLLSEVASTYVQIRTFQGRLQVAHENIDIQEKALAIAEAQFQAGAVTELDVAQAQSVLAGTRALVPGLEAGLRAAENGLFTLLGSPPRKASELLGDGPIPTAPPEVTIGIPADLIRRRPDIRRAERNVAAQSAFVGVSMADLYPRFSFNGSMGLSANRSFSDLFDGQFYDWSFGPSFDWALFNYGRIINNVRVQDATLESLAVNYQNAVLQAAAEAETAIYDFLKSQAEARYFSEGVEAGKLATSIALAQYEQGAVDYQRVLSAQQILTNQQDNYTSAVGSIALNLIATYKALGGGWELHLGKEYFPMQIQEQMEARTSWGEVFTPKLDANATEPLFVDDEGPLPEGIQRITPEPYVRPDEE